MRALIAAAILAAAVLPFGPARAGEAESLAIDAAKSKAAFSVQHIWVDRVTGTVPIVSGTVVVPDGSVIPLSVNAELDPGKIDSGDRDRNDSLTSSDYFDVKDFPVWSFTSTKISPVSATAFGLDGLLTIHGVAVPEHLNVTERGDAAHRLYHAAGHIDRKAFHMTGSRLDPVIGNIVDVTLDIVLK